MKLIFLIPFILCSLSMFCQTENSQPVKFTLLFDKNEPIRGATLYLKDSNPPYGTISDFNGNAELILQENKSTIELSFLGPYVSFEIIHPTDSVLLNLKDRKVIYFYDNKRIMKRRLKIENE